MRFLPSSAVSLLFLSLILLRLSVTIAIPFSTPLHGLLARSTLTLPNSISSRQAQAIPSRVTGTGVTADCQWRWLSQSTIDHAHCTVRDTACDHHEVYAYLQVGGRNGYKEIGKVKSNKGCGSGDVRDPKANKWTDGLGGAYRARVRACVNDNGIKDTCFSGPWVENSLFF